MTNKTIEVIIDLEGNAEVEASGFSDGACLKETEALEDALGVVTGRKRKNYTGAAVGTPAKTKIGKA